jgi:hypothetical protein
MKIGRIRWRTHPSSTPSWSTRRCCSFTPRLPWFSFQTRAYKAGPSTNSITGYRRTSNATSALFSGSGKVQIVAFHTQMPTLATSRRWRRSGGMQNNGVQVYADLMELALTIKAHQLFAGRSLPIAQMSKLLTMVALVHHCHHCLYLRQVAERHHRHLSQSQNPQPNLNRNRSQSQQHHRVILHRLLRVILHQLLRVILHRLAQPVCRTQIVTSALGAKPLDLTPGARPTKQLARVPIANFTSLR